MNLRTAVLAWAFASAAFAQIDSYAVRAKLGMPLNRETYDVPSGIRVVVDYGPSAQACRIELASQPGANFATKQQLNAVADELVPLTLRGKELRRMMLTMGVISMSSVEYEKVDISEPGGSDAKPSLTVAFKTAECVTQPVH